jgi:hypothetical protein
VLQRDGFPPRFLVALGELGLPYIALSFTNNLWVSSGSNSNRCPISPAGSLSRCRLCCGRSGLYPLAGSWLARLF